MELDKLLEAFVASKILGSEETQLWAQAQARGVSGADVYREKLGVSK